MFSSTAPRDVVHDFANALASFHPAGLRSMAQACTENLSEVLPTIRVPTLLIYGDDDTRAPQGVAAQLHEAIPNSKLELLPGAGHICNIDSAEAFNATLRRFLRKHSPESSRE
jgi:pimeloyl-ACP methyl ester carboxylesterase